MKKVVPFVDLGRAHSAYKVEILHALASLIDRSAFVLGAEVEKFERAFASYLGAEHVVGVNSGLDALKLSLQALGVGPGDEVITAANTFIATALAISATGATPVLADVEEDSFNIDISSLRKQISSRTRAIIPVHLYGQSADMAAIVEVARQHGLKVIEDAAQAHGARYAGQSCGTIGDVGCFSFYPSKNLGSFGEGGATVCHDTAVAERLKTLRNVGQKEKYVHELLGHNSRLHAMQAVILEIKLRHLDEENTSRKQSAELYRKLLSEVEEIRLPAEMANRTHVYHLFVITTRSRSERDALRDHLQGHGVQTGIHYPIPIHRQKCYAFLGYERGSFPVAESVSDRILSLPIFAGMLDSEVVAVADFIKSYYALNAVA